MIYFHMDNLCSRRVFGPMEAAEVEMEKEHFPLLIKNSVVSEISHSGFLDLERC